MENLMYKVLEERFLLNVVDIVHHRGGFIRQFLFKMRG